MMSRKRNLRWLSRGIAMLTEETGSVVLFSVVVVWLVVFMMIGIGA